LNVSFILKKYNNIIKINYIIYVLFLKMQCISRIGGRSAKENFIRIYHINRIYRTLFSNEVAKQLS